MGGHNELVVGTSPKFTREGDVLSLATQWGRAFQGGKFQT